MNVVDTQNGGETVCHFKRTCARFRVQTDAGVLNFISTTTVFGSPTNSTLHEMALETFFPADDFTRTALQKLV